MGVTGLTTFVKRNEDKCSSIKQLHGLNLAVDLSAFVWHCCETVAKSKEQDVAGWLALGGDPAEISAWTKIWVDAMRSLGNKLIFVDDPPHFSSHDAVFKEEEREERNEQKIRRARKIARGIFNREVHGTTSIFTSDTSIQEDFVHINAVFPMAERQIVKTLKDLKVSVLIPQSEADKYLGQLVTNNQVNAVVSRDSDFLIMRGMHYIPLNTIEVQKQTIVGRVYTPELLATSLEILPPQLVDMAILVGNDFTHVLHDQFNLLTSLGVPVSQYSGKNVCFPPSAANWLNNTKLRCLLDHPVLYNICIQSLQAREALRYIYDFYGYLHVFGYRFGFFIEDDKTEPRGSSNLILEETNNKLRNDRLRNKLKNVLGENIWKESARVRPSVPSKWKTGRDSIHASFRLFLYLSLGKGNETIQEFILDENTKQMKGRSIGVKKELKKYMQQRLGSMKERPSFKQLEALTRGNVHKRRQAFWHISNFLLCIKKEKKKMSPLAAPKKLFTQWKSPKHSIAFASLLLFLTFPEKCQPNAGFSGLDLDVILLTVCICLSRSAEAFNRWRVNVDISHPRCCDEGMYKLSFWFIEHVVYVIDLASALNVKNTEEFIVHPYSLYSAEVFSTVCALSRGRMLAAGLPKKKYMEGLRQILTDLDPGKACTDLFWMWRSTLLKMHSDIQLANGKAIMSVERSVTEKVDDLISDLSRISISDDSKFINGVEDVSVDHLIGESPSPISDESSSPSPRVELENLMETLPAFGHRDVILNAIRAQTVTVIHGETGCGKSTVVPQLILDDCLRREEDVNIFVTQPRRVAATTLADTVSGMRKEKLGHKVGYRIGQQQHCSSSTVLTYVTTGYMLERLLHSAESRTSLNFTHIILDEVHERSMDVDLTLLVLKRLIPTNPKLKIVIMSATIDAATFLEYFREQNTMESSDVGQNNLHDTETVAKKKKPSKKSKKKSRLVDGAIFVGTSLYNVRSIFLEDIDKSGLKLENNARSTLSKLIGEFSNNTKNNTTSCGEKQLQVIIPIVRAIINQANQEVDVPPTCILIFVPGRMAITTLHDQLEQCKDLNLSLFVLYSEIEIEQQAKAFSPAPRGKTKVILSTDIAESSVTIPDVTHVINTGQHKQIVLHEEYHTEQLILTWCSRSSVKQRTGRAGRLRKGTAFHLFTKPFFQQLKEYTIPELLRKPLDKIVLQFKAKLNHLGDPSDLLSQALDSPQLADINEAFTLLFEEMALNHPSESESSITPFGRFCTQLPIEIRLCRLLWNGIKFNYAVDGILLTAILSCPDLGINVSKFHATSAASYLCDMQKSFLSREEIDGGQWSEPLSIWRLYVQCMKANKSTQLKLLKHHMISHRRWSSMNLLIADICARLTKISRHHSQDKILTPAMCRQIAGLYSFATSDGKRNQSAHRLQSAPESCLRFIIIVTLHDRLFKGAVTKKKNQENGETRPDKEKQLTCLKMKIDKDFFYKCPENLEAIFQPLCGSEYLVTSVNFEGKSKIVINFSPSTANSVKNGQDDLGFVSIAPFPISFAFFVRGGRFPISLPLPKTKNSDELSETDSSLVRNSPEHLDEEVIAARLDTNDSLVLSWKRVKDGTKGMTAERSIFSLPLTSLKHATGGSVHAVCARNLYLTNKSMHCNGWTMLPHDPMYLPTVLLVTATRMDSVWVFLDVKSGDIASIKIGGSTISIADGSLFPSRNLESVNRLREALSTECLFSDLSAALNGIFTSPHQNGSVKTKLITIRIHFDDQACSTSYFPSYDLEKFFREVDEQRFRHAA